MERLTGRSSRDGGLPRRGSERYGGGTALRSLVAPGYWYDIPRDKAEEARTQFDAFVAAEELEAELVEVAGGVPHRQRIALALEHGGGRFGVLEFFGIQSPVVAGLPQDRSLAVHGFWMQDEEFSDRWRWVSIESGTANGADRGDRDGLGR